MQTIIVTGAAGFIGAATAKRLLGQGDVKVIGIDNLNDYYDPALKQARLDDLQTHPNAQNFRFVKEDFTNLPALTALFTEEKPTIVLHLGAQASVRYGLKNPLAYLNSNLIGHFNILEAIRTSAAPVEHFLYASSSSVYGSNAKIPFEETDDVSHPQSLYAATKASCELVSYSWAHQFKLPSTGMRFFTVYGPWGRPDMSPMIFANAILSQKPIPLFNSGDLWRDFTFIDDIVEAILRLIPLKPQTAVPHTILNLGNQNPVKMTGFVTTLARLLEEEPIIDNLPWPPTEIYQTFASTQKLNTLAGWSPSTSLEEGLSAFATWYKPRHGQIKI